jgi:hypothetical protein
MSVAACFVGGWGHARPLLPVVRLARQLGHAITWAGQESVLGRLAALGDATVPIGPTTLQTEALPLLAVDRPMERSVMRDHFVTEFGDVRARALGAWFEEHRPDVVVCDEVDVGAVIAAEQRSVPCVVVADILAGRLTADDVIGDAWRTLRAAHGLDDDPTGEPRWGTLGIYPAPRSLRDPVLAWPPRLVPVRPPILDDVGELSNTAPDRSLVYATLGTVFNLESGDLLDRLAVALDRCGRRSILTVGPHVDVARFVAKAPDVRIEPFADHGQVLPRAAVVVFHGGSGTLVEALAFGVPVVVLPMGADQPDNADRCVELGVGTVLDPLTATADEIADAIDRVIGEPRFTAAVDVLADEARTQPAVADVTALVDLLTVT